VAVVAEQVLPVVVVVMVQEVQAQLGLTAQLMQEAEVAAAEKTLVLAKPEELVAAEQALILHSPVVVKP
jgi:hypothetical protein